MPQSDALKSVNWPIVKQAIGRSDIRQTWGVEVKSAMTALPRDGRGLRRLAEQCGRDFRGGVLLHTGGSTFLLQGANLLAVPLARLWDR